MHRSESRALATCIECGAEIAPASDRSFGVGSETFLCFACAVRRGGRFDEQHDRWIAAPEVSDLARPDE